MEKIASKIFIDSGDSLETKSAKDILGFIDGQTTNPTLIAKNPEVQKYLEKGKKLNSRRNDQASQNLSQLVGKRSS